MRSTIAYTTARILLFVAATGVLYVVGARGLLLLGLALLVSGIASYVLLSRQRDAMSGALAARMGGVRGRVSDFRTRLDAGTRAEDDDGPEPAAPAGAAQAGAVPQPGAAPQAGPVAQAGAVAQPGAAPQAGPVAQAGAVAQPGAAPQAGPGCPAGGGPA